MSGARRRLGGRRTDWGPSTRPCVREGSVGGRRSDWARSLWRAAGLHWSPGATTLEESVCRRPRAAGLQPGQPGVRLGSSVCPINHGLSPLLPCGPAGGVTYSTRQNRFQQIPVTSTLLSPASFGKGRPRRKNIASFKKILSDSAVIRGRAPQDGPRGQTAISQHDNHPRPQ